MEGYLGMRTCPSLQAAPGGVLCPAVVDVSDCVGSSRLVCAGTDASSGGVGAASGVGSLADWRGNRDHGRVCLAATGFFSPVDRVSGSRSVGL